MSNTENYVTRILNRLKDGDESKLKRFRKYLRKTISSQIKSREDDLEDVDGKLDDHRDMIEEFILDVDVTRIKTVDDSKEYSEELLVDYMGLVETEAQLEKSKVKIIQDIERLAEFNKSVD